MGETRNSDRPYRTMQKTYLKKTASAGSIAEAAELAGCLGGAVHPE